MTLALLIGVPLALIVIYGIWMAGELGLGPTWRRSISRPTHTAEGPAHEPDDDRTVPTDR